MAMLRLTAGCLPKRSLLVEAVIHIQTRRSWAACPSVIFNYCFSHSLSPFVAGVAQSITHLPLERTWLVIMATGFHVVIIIHKAFTVPRVIVSVCRLCNGVNLSAFQSPPSVVLVMVEMGRPCSSELIARPAPFNVSLRMRPSPCSVRAFVSKSLGKRGGGRHAEAGSHGVSHAVSRAVSHPVSHAASNTVDTSPGCCRRG